MNIIKLNAIDSTNSYLKSLARNTQLPDETVVLAEQQLSGRGQMGNSWFSKQGQSLTFSVFKEFKQFPIDRQFMISMAVSIGVVKTLKELNIPSLTIKWPNDILSAKNKIGGMLIENVVEGSCLKYGVMGIGLNVNISDFPHLPKASSLKLVTGKSFDTNEVLSKILFGISSELEDLSQRDFLKVKIIYEQNLFQKDVISVFETPEGILFNGIIKGVTEIGELLVETENGIVQKFQLKQVRLIY